MSKSFLIFLKIKRVLKCLALVFFVTFGFIKVKPLYDKVQEVKELEAGFYSIKLLSDRRPIYHFTKVRPDQWVELKDISKRLTGAIISSEDGWFYRHHGYDVEAMKKAFAKSLKSLKKIHGGSTITQQLAKNLYLTKDRTYARKMWELYFTILLEENLTKNKILETYLNVIEYGEGIYGISSAAQFYFQKRPKELNARESAFLAMLLPSPKRYSQSFKKRVLTSYASRTIQTILLKMNQGGYIGPEEYSQAISSKFKWESDSSAIAAKEVQNQSSLEEDDAVEIDRELLPIEDD